MGMVQVKKSHYSPKVYDTKERLCSYWYQIEEVMKSNLLSVLEIGVGNGFVSSRLKTQGLDVTTLDIDKRLCPDNLGSVLSMPFEDDSFDLTACFQVLEHLPYSEFDTALSEIFRVTRSRVILSLPDVERIYKVCIEKYKASIFKKYMEIPRRNKPVYKFNGEHYWEIGRQNYPFNRVYNDIRDIGFNIERTYRIFENPYHRFFVLTKNEGKASESRELEPSAIRLANFENWRDKYFEENFSVIKIIKKCLRLVFCFNKK